MKVGGIDEAGRGPVIGPMIVCGYEIEEEKIEYLKELGVRDSKEMSPEEREEIFPELLRIADKVILRAVLPKEIDKYVSLKLSLNNLELLVFSEIIKEMDADVIYVDSPSRNTKKVENFLREMTGKNVIARNKADKEFPVVSAASVIAKVTRDRYINALKREFGDFGSGYPSDPKTIEFLKRNLNKIDKKMIRRSWETYQRISQRNLLDFV